MDEQFVSYVAGCICVCVQESRSTDRAHYARCLSARARGGEVGAGGTAPGRAQSAIAARRRRASEPSATPQPTLRPSIRENETSISGTSYFLISCEKKYDKI